MIVKTDVDELIYYKTINDIEFKSRQVKIDA